MLIDLIEDDPLMGEALTERLQIEGFECRWRVHAAQLLHEASLGAPLADAVVCDVRLPDMEGPDLHEALPAAWRQIPWVFITGYGTAAQRHKLMARGAADFFTKPLDLDRLIQRLHGLRGTSRAPVVAAALRSCPLGISGEMRKLHALVQRLGTHWDSVLITGESGAGKEELARCLHRETLGTQAPFIAVNTSSLPESLIEAELFGYEKGAFTGAARSHRGLFEQAHGGTLFLDEIGDMPAAMQVKLLRVIQDRQVTRLGSETPRQIQVRLIFATHKRLNEEVRAGRFREDLYYRINVVHLQVPPLRDRPEDIVWLAQRFLEQWNATHPGATRRLNAAGEDRLAARNWPGNVRELRNCIERACLLSETELIDPVLLDDAVPTPAVAVVDPAIESPASSQMLQLEAFLRQQERAYIQQALARHNWQIGVTADALGISRKNLWERMKRLAIQ